jgi:GTP-binding protein HflX
MHYLLPRLSGMWTHLERQKEWNAWTWGTEIETDRRIVQTIELKDKIKKNDKQMGTQRGNRGAMVV